MWHFLNYNETMERSPVGQTPPHFPLTINPPPLQRIFCITLQASNRSVHGNFGSDNNATAFCGKERLLLIDMK
jgi:hypothetical protein